MFFAEQVKERLQKSLKRAIKEEGYQGFLTLEPHLVLFDALQSLETENAENIIKENKAKDGAEGYSMQYHALIDILDSIEKSTKEDINMEKVRFGLIGIGAQGGAYAGIFIRKGWIPGMPAPECPPHCALGALCDIDPEKEAMCKEKYPEVPFFKDWKEMVASGTVDAVITTVHITYIQKSQFTVWNME